MLFKYNSLTRVSISDLKTSNSLINVTSFNESSIQSAEHTMKIHVKSMICR